MAIEWVRLELDTRSFDRSPFLPTVDAVVAAGVSLTTLAALGDTDVNRRRLYELNAECSADIPDRGPFHSWDDYARLRLDVPSFDPGGVVLALDGDEWIGLSASSDHRENGFVFNEMTGVTRPHRRRGIALAMKVTGLDFAVQLEVARVRTLHHPANTGMISLNRRLGFVDAGDDLEQS
jgi:RimJ/RimL family protein N-acetyltransferase